LSLQLPGNGQFRAKNSFLPTNIQPYVLSNLL
jgi:hypothetical protein